MDETEMNPDELLDRAVDAMREVQPPRPFSTDRFVHSLPGPGGQPRKGKTLFGRPLATRRLRVAAALAILSGLIVTVVLTRMPGTVALGDVIDQFRRARGMTARVTIKMPGQPPRTYRAMFLGDRSRSQTPDTIEIADPSRGEALTLDLRQKTATMLHLARPLPATRPAADPQAVDWFVELQQLQQGQGRAIGRRMIQGRDAEGFEVKKAGSTILLWADRQTREPWLIQVMTSLDGNEVAAVEMDQITLCPQLPEFLFSLDVPPGYSLRHVRFHVNDKPVGEEDLIEFLRRYAELNDGAVPASHWRHALGPVPSIPAAKGSDPTGQPGADGLCRDRHARDCLREQARQRMALLGGKRPPRRDNPPHLPIPPRRSGDSARDLWGFALWRSGYRRISSEGSNAASSGI